MMGLRIDALVSRRSRAMACGRRRSRRRMRSRRSACGRARARRPLHRRRLAGRGREQQRCGRCGAILERRGGLDRGRAGAPAGGVPRFVSAIAIRSTDLLARAASRPVETRASGRPT
jgi:hypothetical protein